ncbi:hypothetical protein GLA29479_807 [Lysobacter antibioticus]|nr:hypothetical protein GLA29479_807 [Lysobacter antibioticus]
MTLILILILLKRSAARPRERGRGLRRSYPDGLRPVSARD